MGQGVLTSMAMIIAEELGCDFAKVKVEYASAHRNLIDGNVYQSMGRGARSVRSSRVFLQQAGASARARLISAAAARWGVEPTACVASDSLVRHDASGRSATFGELAADAAKVALAAEPAIKTPDQFKLIGQGLKRIDTPLKVTGSAHFGIDTRLPGMAYASVANCPVFGGNLNTYDFSAISGRRGIIAATPVTNGVAVVADDFWRAKEALKAMPVEWDFGPAGSTDSAQFAAEYRAALDGPLADGGGHGDSNAAFAQPAKVVEALYEVPLSGARSRWSRSTRPRIGRETALTSGWARDFRNRRSRSLRKRAGSSARRSSSTIASSAAGLAGARSMTNSRRRLKCPRPSSGRSSSSGRAKRTSAPTVIAHRRRSACARLCATMGRPWASTSPPPSARSCARSVGRASRRTASSAWRSRAWQIVHTAPTRSRSASTSRTRMCRSCSGARSARRRTPSRSKAPMTNTARAAKRDPVEYRRALLEGKPDFLAVLDALAEKGDWGKPLPKGVGRGLAIHEAFGTIVGEIAEVAVSDRGEVKVQRVVKHCVDCGHLVNPLTAAMQIESAVMYGLTAALFGEITIKQGRVEQGNFDAYPIARMADAPVIETHFVLSGGDKWGGLGEPGTPPIAPAIANAVFAVTGKRIRSLPLRNASLGV